MFKIAGYFVSLCCVVLLAACSNENIKPKPPADSPKYSVALKINQFAENFPPSPDARIFNLHYLVYDSGGRQVSRIQQIYLSGTNNSYRIIDDKKTELKQSVPFGTITDSLSAGVYRFVLIGESGPSNIDFNQYSESNWPVKNGTFPERDFPYATINKSFSLSEIFKYEGTHKISSDGTINNINLERFLPELGILVSDAVPANVNRIRYLITDYNNYHLDSGQPIGTFGEILSSQQVPDYIGKPGYTRSSLLFNTITAFDFSISYTGTNDAVIQTKVVKNILLKPKTRTMVKINLFNSNPNDYTVTETAR